MKKIILAFLLACAIPSMAQNKNEAKYLAGAVPVNSSGFVQFEKTYRVNGKSQAEIYSLLKDYTLQQIVKGENHLPQARIQDADSLKGIVVAGMEEYLYFKRTAWVNDRVRFYYQLIFTVQDGGFKAEMRNLRYIYDDVPQEQMYRAEDWITDKAALNKDKTKLVRVPGKFRRFTIDRKDEIFKEAARATGAIRKVKKSVVIEEEDDED